MLNIGRYRHSGLYPVMERLSVAIEDLVQVSANIYRMDVTFLT